MANRQSTYIALGGMCIGVLVLALTNRDLIYQHFPMLSNLFHLNASNANSQQMAVQMQYEKTMKSADDAITAAEAALAEADKNEQQEAADKAATQTWEMADTSELKPTTKLHEKVKVFSAVKVNMHPSHLPAEGEQIE